MCETEAKRLDFVTAKVETKRLLYYTGPLDEPRDSVIFVGRRCWVHHHVTYVITVGITLKRVMTVAGRTLSIILIEASPFLVMRLFAASSCRIVFAGVVILYL